MSEETPDTLTRQKRHVQKRRAEGKCGREGCPNDPGTRYLCPKHREAARQRMRAHRRG